MRVAVMTAALIILLVAGSARAQPVLHYYGSLTSGRGDPFNGPLAMRVTIFDSETAGTSMWTESLPSVSVEAGVFDAVLGLSTHFSPELFQQPAFIEVTVDGAPLGPRQRIGAAPLAFFAEQARTTRNLACSNCVAEGHLAPGAVTRAKLAQDGCSVGDLLTYASGGWSCSRPDGQYSLGPGLVLDGTRLSLPLDCIAGQTLKWSGQTWSCSDDLNSGAGGTVTAVTATGGLSGGTIISSGTIAIATGGVTPDKLAPCTALDQILKWDGTGWLCAADENTGTLTSVAGSAGVASVTDGGAVTLGLAPRGVSFDKIASCNQAGEVMRWDGSAWQCSRDDALDGYVQNQSVVDQNASMRIAGDAVIRGRVGIGTDAPTLTSILHVAGNVRIEGDLTVSNGLNATRLNGFNTNTTTTPQANMIPVTDADGKLRREILPFSQGDLLAPADRPLVSGLSTYGSAYFDVSSLGISGPSASNVVAGVRFGPGRALTGTAATARVQRFENINGLRYSGPGQTSAASCCFGCSIAAGADCVMQDDTGATAFCRHGYRSGAGGFDQGRCVERQNVGGCLNSCIVGGTPSCGFPILRSISGCLSGDSAICTKIDCYSAL